jgi:hypothetical protein
MRLIVVVCALVVLACGSASAPVKELQRAKAGKLSVVLLSSGESIKQGKSTFVVEFRDEAGTLIDAGTVNVNAMMPMAGMAPMIGDCTVTPTSTKGRYDVASDLNMAGTWRLQIAWNGPAGQGSVSMPGSVL